ncbi:MAG: hypothetical protein ACFFDP_11110, partial [Promethearchaeota archaeon]
MFLVIKIGGSLLFRHGGQLDLKRYKEYAEVIRKIVDQDHKLVIVIGGGTFAKTLVNECKKLGSSREALDRL